jgi:hypothetical protein
MVVPDLAPGKPRHFDPKYATGQRFGRVMYQSWRSAAKQKKPGWHFRTIGQNAQQFENSGDSLNFINYY